MARHKSGALQEGRFGVARDVKKEVDPWESRKRNIGEWVLRHSEQRNPEVDYSEWKVPVHREVKFMGLKNHRLLDGGEGK